MSKLLTKAAVGRLSGTEAQEAMNEYIRTNPWMVHNRTLDVTPQPAQSPGAGGDSQLLPVKKTMSVVPEYEVFKNERNALAFFSTVSLSLTRRRKKVPSGSPPTARIFLRAPKKITPPLKTWNPASSMSRKNAA